MTTQHQWIIPFVHCSYFLSKCKQSNQRMHSNLKANNLFAMNIFVVNYITENKSLNNQSGVVPHSFDNM